MFKKVLLILIFNTFLSNALNDTLSIKNNCVQNYIDSIFISTGIDTSVINSLYLSANIKDWLKHSTELNVSNSTCTDYLIFFPDLNNSFDPVELDLLLGSENIDENSLLYFLEDNFIRESLYKVFVDVNNEPVKLVRLSTDINIDFGVVISTSYYKDKLLRFYINNYCETFNNRIIIRLFDYNNFDLITEEILIIEKNEILHKTRTIEGIVEKRICH
jgi:hypothetical protein